MLVQAKFPDKIWSKVEEITPKYSYSKMEVTILDEKITIQEKGYLRIPEHNEYGDVISESITEEITNHEIHLSTIRDQYLEDSTHFALDYDGNVIPLTLDKFNKNGYLRLAMSVCNRCMAYIFFPTSECTFADTLIVIPTSQETDITANSEILVGDYKSVNLSKLRNLLFPNMKVTHPSTVKAGDVCYFTVELIPTDTSVNSGFTMMVRSFSGIAVKTLVTCSDTIPARVPVLTTGLEPGDKVEVGFKFVDNSKNHNRFNTLYKVTVV